MMAYALLAAQATVAPRIAAQTPTFSTLYAFTGVNGDGATPFAGVTIGANGALYGTTLNGGASQCGTIFQLAPPVAPGAPWAESVIYSFTLSDGCDAETGVVMGSGGTLYGVSGESAFALAPPSAQGGAWLYSVLYEFECCTDGFAPSSGVTLGKNGTLYGTTTYGGGVCGSAVGGCGTVYELAPPATPGGAWAEAVLYSFTAPQPNSGLVRDPSGALYGTTAPHDGASKYEDTVYRLTPPAEPGGTWTHHVLTTFDASTPEGVIIDPKGALYGVTLYGGITNSNCPYGGGTVYQLTPPSAPGAPWTNTLLYEFTGENGDGCYPVGLAENSAGVLYGTTQGGGNPACTEGYGCGTIFRLAPPTAAGGTWTESVVYSFTGGSDGYQPNGGLAIGRDGAIYGTTASEGGATPGQGTVFRFTP